MTETKYLGRSSVSYSYRHSGQLPGSMPRIYSAAPTVQIKFDLNRDPLIARQMADRGKSEFERRNETLNKETRRESFMVKRQQARPVMRPPLHMSLGPDRASFNTRWAQERRDALIAERAQLQLSKDKLEEIAEERKHFGSNDTSGLSDRQRFILTRKFKLEQARMRKRKRSQSQ